MLLSGIYYGKTPISVVYKNGYVIWKPVEYKHFDLGVYDIHSMAVAYITEAAWNEIKIQYNMTVDIDADMQSSSAGSISINGSTMSESKASIKLQTLFNLGYVDIIQDNIASASYSKSKNNGIDIMPAGITDVNAQSSVAKASNIDNNVCVDLDANAFIARSKAHIVDHEIDVINATNMNSSGSRANVIDTEISLDHIADANVQPSKANIINTEMLLDYGSPLDSVKAQALEENEQIYVDIDATAHVSEANNEFMHLDMNMHDAVYANVSQTHGTGVLQSISIDASNSELAVLKMIYGSTDEPIISDTESDITHTQSINLDLSKLIKATPNLIFMDGGVHKINLDGLLTIKPNTNITNAINTEVSMYGIAYTSGDSVIDISSPNLISFESINYSGGIQVLNNQDTLEISFGDMMQHSVNANLYNQQLDNTNYILSECNILYNVSLDLDETWEYPVKSGTNLLITQAFSVSQENGRLILI